MRILIIDDQVLDAVLTKSALASIGCEHQVFVACDGDMAGQLIATEVFDLLLLDINMPGIDGLAVLAQLRERAESRVPVVMLSGADPTVHRPLAEALGAVDYVHKAISLPDFKNALQTTLTRLGFC